MQLIRMYGGVQFPGTPLDVTPRHYLRHSAAEGARLVLLVLWKSWKTLATAASDPWFESHQCKKSTSFTSSRSSKGRKYATRNQCL